MTTRTIPVATAGLSRTSRLIIESAIFAGVVAFGYTLTPRAGEPAIWWPPIGAFIAWLLSRPKRDWPLVLGLGTLIRLALAVSNGLPATVALWIVTGSVIGSVVSSLALRRFMGDRVPLSEPYDIVAFGAVAILVSGPIAAISAALYRIVVTGTPLTWLSPLHWSLGESVGVLLIAPLLLTMNDAIAWWRTSPALRRVELSAVLLMTVVSAYLALFSPLDSAEVMRPVLGLMLLPSVWAALRIGLFAVTWTQVIIGAAGAWGLIRGVGVLMALPSSHDRHVLLFQTYSLVLAVVSMLIAAAFASQRRSVQRARESEALFRGLVEALPVALLVEGDEAEPSYHNGRLTSLLGAVDRALGVDAWWSRLGVSAAQRAELRGDDAVEGAPARAPVTADLMGADGTTRHVELHVASVGNRHITAIVDLTDRARLEGELRQAHKLEALGTLAGGVAHDFNNILGAVIGNLDLSRRALPAGHEASAYLSDAESASKRAAEMVKQILTFSRQQDQERSVLTLGAVFREAVSHLRALAKANVTVQLAEGQEVPHVLGDSTQLHQVLMNLGTNALHAMRAKGGTLTLALESVEVTSDLVRRHPELREGRYARITVGDTGVGMSAETLERAFEPFFTTKQPGQGTGLGLAVVHGVVRAHDGAIISRSAPGEGTWFAVYLPGTMGTPPQGVPIIEPEPAMAGLRVLAVDDEPALARLVERALTRAGGAPKVFTKPGALLELLRAHPDDYDVVLTDLTMPEMSGFALANEVHRIRPGMPILLMSGFSAAMSADTLRAEGVRAMLQKPFTPDELCRAVLDVARATAGAGVA